MNKFIFTIGLSLLITLPSISIAGEDFIAEQRKSLDTLSPEKAEVERQKILKMASETLERFYLQYPETKEKIKNAYGYGIFQSKAVNLLVYVAGKGSGVVFDNQTKTPIFMNSIRAGTGPGLGYKSLHGIFIFSNKGVYSQFTTTGLQLSASADAVVKVAGIGAEAGEAISLVPGITYYQLTNTGLVLQANWGITEFLRSPDLNSELKSERKH